MAGDRRVKPVRFAVAAAGIALAFGAADARTGVSPSRPDLTETAVVVLQRSAPAGGSVRINDVVVNRGAATAARSTTSYRLVPGRVLLGRRRVARLRPSAVLHRSVALRVPATVAAGRYRVQACADDLRRVREASEANNCRASGRLLTVTRGTDRTPPRFAGLVAATTCIPGPIGEGRSASYRLRWDPAADDRSPASSIVYDVYEATTSGGEAFATATYTTDPGAATFTTPPLSSAKTFYFVVRARDRSGNRDANRVERQGVNLCL
jgi:hypothetical protein